MATPRDLRIDFVRHGETQWNRVRRVQGRGPTRLNDLGERQAARLAQRFGEVKLDALYASGLVRAMQTAKPLAEAIGRDLIVDERFAEVDVGEVEGMTLDDLTRHNPDVLRLWLTAPDLLVYPGGEAIVDVQKRMLGALDDLRLRHEAGRVVVVSHQFALSTLFAAILGMPLRRLRAFRLSAGSVTSFEWTEHGPQLVSFNSTLACR